MEISDILKAINNPMRLKMLQWLKEPKGNFVLTKQLIDADENGVCVTIIQEKSGLSQSTVSAYLATLQRAKLVTSKRVGGWTYYQRNEETIAQFLAQLNDAL